MAASNPQAVLPVEVIRSPRRRRTLSARLHSGVIEVRVPAGMDPDTEAAQVADLVAKVRRRIVGDEVDLQVLGRQLADHYGLPHPTSVEWSARMAHRWGSCSISSGRIRLSDRLIHTPTWVRDHVLLHELAHLVEPAHGPAFQALIERDPNAERAAGYLAALDHMADRGLLDWTRG